MENTPIILDVEEKPVGISERLSMYQEAIKRKMEADEDQKGDE